MNFLSLKKWKNRKKFGRLFSRRCQLFPVEICMMNEHWMHFWTLQFSVANYDYFGMEFVSNAKNLSYHIAKVSFNPFNKNSKVTFPQCRKL